MRFHLSHRPHGFTLRHVGLLLVLLAMGVLASADRVVPIGARLPGFFILAALAVVLLVRRPRAS